MKQDENAGPADPVWVRVCAAAGLDPSKRLASRRAILEDPRAQDCTLYRADEAEADAEEEELGDARIRFAGAFRAPDAWSAAERAEYFADEDPALFSCAHIECLAAVSTAAFFTPEVGDYVAVMSADGLVEMFFVHDYSEDEAGRLCVLIRDDEPLF